MDVPSRYRYCPYDGTPLVEPTEPPPRLPKGVGNKCPLCDYVDYRNPTPAVAVLICEGGRILLGRRAREPEKGKWDIPGGFVDYEDTVEQTIAHEAEDETGLKVELEKYLGSFHDFYDKWAQPTLTLVFLVRWMSGNLLAGDDLCEVQWFDLDAIPAELAFPHQARAIALLRAYLQSGT